MSHQSPIEFDSSVAIATDFLLVLFDDLDVAAGVVFFVPLVDFVAVSFEAPLATVFLSVTPLLDFASDLDSLSLGDLLEAVLLGVLLGEALLESALLADSLLDVVLLAGALLAVDLLAVEPGDFEPVEEFLASLVESFFVTSFFVTSFFAASCFTDSLLVGLLLADSFFAGSLPEAFSLAPDLATDDLPLLESDFVDTRVAVSDFANGFFAEAMLPTSVGALVSDLDPAVDLASELPAGVGLLEVTFLAAI